MRCSELWETVVMRTGGTIGRVWKVCVGCGHDGWDGQCAEAFRAPFGMAGILVLLIAIDMLYARHLRTKQTPSEADEAGEREAVAVVPLGIPLLSGPGAISTAILYAQKSDEISHLILLCVCIVLVGFITWTVFRLAEPFRRILGLTGINVCTRLMGLLLAAIAVEFIAEGLKQLFPFLETAVTRM